jgi:hypothetical protein
MPKEIIHSRSEKFDIEISWDAESGRDDEVQIGLATRDHAKTLADALIPASAQVDRDERATRLGEFRGIYGQFDRASLNRTIRLLRKARDHVYGRDE